MWHWPGTVVCIWQSSTKGLKRKSVRAKKATDVIPVKKSKSCSSNTTSRTSSPCPSANSKASSVSSHSIFVVCILPDISNRVQQWRPHDGQWWPQQQRPQKRWPQTTTMTAKNNDDQENDGHSNDGHKLCQWRPQQQRLLQTMTATLFVAVIGSIKRQFKQVWMYYRSGTGGHWYIGAPGRQCVHQNFFAWYDVVAAILKLWRRIKNLTQSVDVYFLEEQSCQMSFWSQLKRRLNHVASAVVFFLFTFSVLSADWLLAWYCSLSVRLSVCNAVCIVELRVCVGDCVGDWKLYHSVPRRALPIHFFGPFCCRIYRLAKKHSERLKTWQASKADFSLKL